MKLLLAAVAAFLPGPLKRALLRRTGLRIGEGVRIGIGTLIVCERGELADGASIGRFCIIRVRELRLGRRAVIQNMVRVAVHSLELKSQAQICSENELRGDIADPRSAISIGPASWILPHCYINVARRITLGRNVGVGGGSYLFTHGMWLSKLDGYPVAYGDIDIADDVWLPWGCFIMPNISIGAGVVVGACSVVTKPLQTGVLAAGVPAKVIREKSNVDLTVEQRLAILVEVTESYGAQAGRPVRIERTPEREDHYVGDALVLAVHVQPPAALAPAPALNVVFGPLPPAAQHTATWTLDGYACSPYAQLSEPARAWLQQGRLLGIRYYPSDED